MKKTPDLNSAFAQASSSKEQETSSTAPSKGVNLPKAVSEDGRIVTMDMLDMDGTYSIGRDVTGGMMIAIATKDYTFLISPDWAARGSFEAYAYPKDGKGATAVWSNGNTNNGNTKAAEAYLEARGKWEQAMQGAGTGNNRFYVEGTVSGGELTTAARDAYNEQAEWKASISAKPAPSAPSLLPSP